MAVFGDWRGLSTASAGMTLDPRRVYYWHSRTHGFKGLIGGTHGHISFYDGRWLTVEITDQETLEYQDCEIVHRTTSEYQTRGAFISTRRPDQQWFGNTTRVVSSCYDALTVEQVSRVCDNYPFKEFDLVTRNCNTLVSYLIYNLDLALSRPWISIGYKSRNYWKNFKCNHDLNTQKIIILNGVGVTPGGEDPAKPSSIEYISDTPAGR